MTLLIVALAWLALTATGWLVLAPLQRPCRDALLPGAPLFGVVLFVVVLHDTTLLFSVRVGVWLLAIVLVVLGVVATRRDSGWWRPSRGAVVGLLLAAACGVLPAVWALGPSLAVGDSGIIQPSSNNDAFYYVTVADWLQDHPATDVPQIGSTPQEPGVPPSYASARSQLEQHVRIGQELTSAALTTLLGSDEDRTWYPLTALWVLLLPAAGLAAARLLGLHDLSGIVLGLVTSVSALVVFQLASQNSDSLLGTALAPVSLGAVLSAIRRQRRVPPLLAGLALTALIGTYTEFTSMIGPALVAAVLAWPMRELWARLLAALVVLGLGVVSAPWAWVRAVQSLLVLGGLPPDNLPTAFAGSPITLVVARFLGVAGPSAVGASWLLLITTFVLVLVGVLAAVALSPYRGFYAVSVGVGVFLAVYLVTVRQRNYTQQRVVQLLLPLVLLAAVAGWDALCRRTRQRRARTAGQRVKRSTRPPVAAVVGLAAALLFVITNSVVDRGLDLTGQARVRHVGPEFSQAAGWLRRVGGPDGRDASVLVGDFFSQLWITDALRDEPDVAYPSLYVSYQYQSSYWAGDSRRWLLTDAAAIKEVGPGVVVEQNARFALLDLSRGKAVVAVPADEMGHDSYLVLRSERGPAVVRLTGSARPRAPTDVPAGPGYGEALGHRRLTPGATSLVIHLNHTVSRRLVLSNQHTVFVVSGITFG